MRSTGDRNTISNMASPQTTPRQREYFSIERSPERQILDLRGQGFDPVRLVGHYHYARAQQELTTHSHGAMIEISYLESGRQIYAVHGRKFPMVGGDVFLTFPGEHHSTGNHPEMRGVLYWVLISVVDAKQSFLSLPHAEGRLLLQRLLHLPRRCFHGSLTLQPTLRAIFEAYANTRNPLRTTDLRNLLLRFLLDIMASADAPHQPTHSAHIRSALLHIAASLDRPLPLTELARRVQLSLPRFKAKFKQEMGIPPADYIAQRKVERAAQLLHETNRSVTDIALQLGFSSSQYFATVFKRYTRHSPREARAARLKL